MKRKSKPSLFYSCKFLLTTGVLVISLFTVPSLYSDSSDPFNITPVSSSYYVSSEEDTTDKNISIYDTKVAKTLGIKEIKDGYPIDGTVAASSLRLRSWPWGEVIGKYNKGDKLKVLGESGEFYLVEINGSQGYMHKSYISTTKATASYETPSYPGNTRSGGCVPLEKVIISSKTGKSTDNNSSLGATVSPSCVNNVSTADYTGVSKAIFDVVKKFCDANQSYVLGSAHSNNLGYVTKSDCSGFTGQFVNKISEMAGVKPVIGNSFPTSTNYANSQYTQKITSTFPPTIPKDLIKPGDIFVMDKNSSGGYGHVGVFMGYNSAGQPLIAHSTTRKADGNTTMGKLGTTGVRVEVIPSSYNKRWMGVYRLNNMDQIAKNLES